MDIPGTARLYLYKYMYMYKKTNVTVTILVLYITGKSLKEQWSGAALLLKCYFTFDVVL